MLRVTALANQGTETKAIASKASQQFVCRVGWSSQAEAQRPRPTEAKPAVSVCCTLLVACVLVKLHASLLLLLHIRKTIPMRAL